MPIAANLYYFSHDTEDDLETKRPPIILIHGAGGNLLSWPPQVRRMVDERVYSLDLPGHGKSEGTGRQSIDEYVEDVLAFMQALKLRTAIFAGVSMGAAVALALTLKHPRKVRGLCLLGSGSKMRVAPLILETAGNPNTFESAVDLINENCFSSEAPQHLKDISKRHLLDVRPPVLLGDFLACHEFDVTSQLKKIRTPTLLICGAADKMTPVRYSELMQETMPNAKLHIVENAGHLVMSEQPDVVADLMKQFVDSIPVRTRKTKKDRVELNVESDPAQETESALPADSVPSTEPNS
ncbi:MAG TPA: alpha/beta hydrolase [Anaerolineales bacterium]|nr:alpha/beta hydrolase [Anaerolineales bacterium]HMZ42904.1 alpha/beta hydrolase [Anaerolineales bacterium]HND90371.1 alpha/beta hydrolase [Anaerolineales bacterium]HNE68204.1 alpha/beta hydrolase [Anaerolineales bacterium]HNH04348.1 alpha/beta hydrolase [Anaerolineales bacterium]